MVNVIEADLTHDGVDNCIWWKEFASARTGNGFVVLVEDEY